MSTTATHGVRLRLMQVCLVSITLTPSGCSACSGGRLASGQCSWAAGMDANGPGDFDTPTMRLSAWYPPRHAGEQSMCGIPQSHQTTGQSGAANSGSAGPNDAPTRAMSARRKS